MSELSRFPFLEATLLIVLVVPSLSWSDTVVSCTHRLTWTDDVIRANVVVAINRNEAKQQLELLVSDGCMNNVKNDLQKLGGTISFGDNRLGYIDAVIPTERLLDAFDLGGIDAAVAWYRPELTPAAKVPKPVPAIKLPIPRVATQLPADGPYFPAAEGGLIKLWKEHPEADGRGTGIAIVDSAIDLLHPAFEKVMDSRGSLVPKIVDTVGVSTPETDDSWVAFGPPQSPHDGKLTFAGRTWIVSAGGPYRLGIYSKEFVLGAAHQPDASRITISVGVLWNPTEDLVWVDTDGDGDFTNNRALSDYAQKQEIDWFGTKVGDQDNRIAFSIKVDHLRDAVYVGTSTGEHATLIAGTASANRLTGGLFDGAAPMARLVDFRIGNLMSAIVLAAQRPDVDVINWSGVIAVPKLPDGRPFLERVLKVYKKPVLCLCEAAGAIDVGDYQSAEMLRRNRQVPPPIFQSVNGVSTTAIVAPSTALTTQSRYLPFTYLGHDGRRYLAEGFPESPAPDGYMIGANASPTISYASGVIASVISLAKQRSVRYDATRIADAVFTSAKQVGGVAASAQGYGLIDAAGMWRQLEAMSKVDDPNNPELTSFQVWHEQDGKRIAIDSYSEEFAEVNGTSLNREIWVARHGGHPGTRAYRLELRDDQGAFALPSASVELPRDVAIRIRFSVVPKGNTQLGFLRLIDADKNVAMHEIALELKAPQRMQTIVPGVQRYETRIPPRKREQQVFAVDSRAQAIGVSIEMPDVGFRGPGDVALTAPGQQITYFPIPQKAGVPLDKEHHIGPMQHVETVITGNLTGLWKLDWDNRGIPEYETPYDSPPPDVPIPASLTVSNYAVSLERTSTRRLKAHNVLADITGHVEFLTGKMLVQTLRSTGARGYASASVRVEPGTAIWRLRIQAATHNLQAHLFVLTCSGQLPWSPCIVVRQANLRNGQAALSINDPEPGEWRVAILPDDQLITQSYELEHTMLKPTATAKDSKLPNGATTEVMIPSNLVAESAGENLSYAAFRLAPIGEQEKGTLIALTPLNEASF